MKKKEERKGRLINLVQQYALLSVKISLLKKNELKLKIIIGEEVRTVRERKEMSLNKFAKEIGVSGAYMSDIERGNRFPSDKILKEIIKILTNPNA